MSRIFDAVQRGGDDLAKSVISALDGASDSSHAPAQFNAEKLLDEALQNLAPLSSPAPAPLPTTISVNQSPAINVPSKQIRAHSTAVRTSSLTVLGNSPLLPFDTANWRASEQYRTVRTRILQHSRKPRLIAVSSAGAGDGKSVTSINVAGALSLKAESHVLLVDADFRRSSVHAQLSLPLEPGLTDILLEKCTLEDALVRAQQFPNFYILPAGGRVDNPSDLLESSRWLKLRQHIIEIFDFTVLDCPPVGAVSEWDLIQSAAEAVIMVGRQDYTNLPEFLKAVQSIPQEKLIGVVLNCVSDWLLMRPYSSYDYPRGEKPARQRRRWF